MSVYKSRRRDAAAQFIADVRELRKRKRKFPCTCRAWMERDGWHYGGQEHEKRRHV